MHVTFAEVHVETMNKFTTQFPGQHCFLITLSFGDDKIVNNPHHILLGSFKFASVHKIFFQNDRSVLLFC